MPREGHDYFVVYLAAWNSDFNPRAPRGARQRCAVLAYSRVCISIHVPREGHDAKLYFTTSAYRNFNPRAPRGARPRHFSLRCAPPEFQSTCPARGTTLGQWPNSGVHYISIHVPREGHDFDIETTNIAGIISIHVPREGHDSNYITKTATQTYFNPRAPRGARREAAASCRTARNFNPRAPRGARPEDDVWAYLGEQFQSTCPARGTTPCWLWGSRTKDISIHVPREGHDLRSSTSMRFASIFQSTCPARGTTCLSLGS